MVCMEHKQCPEIRLRRKKDGDTACVLGATLRTRGVSRPPPPPGSPGLTVLECSVEVW